jgi:hypothetical protein
LLDDNSGKTGQNFRIIYDNQFLQEFLNIQIKQHDDSDQSNSSSSEEAEPKQTPVKKVERPNPDLVYAQYEPRNVMELREYMLYCISRQLQEYESWVIEKEERTIKQRAEMKADMERRNE